MSSLTPDSRGRILASHIEDRVGSAIYDQAFPYPHETDDWEWERHCTVARHKPSGYLYAVEVTVSVTAIGGSASTTRREECPPR